MNTMTKIKLVGIGLLAVLLVILVVQNTESVETKFLFVSLAMPRAVLLFVTFLAGIVAGLLLSFVFAGRKDGDRE